MSKLNNEYTNEELIRRIWDKEEIRMLTARRVYYIANDMREEELNELWVSDPQNQKSASFGRTWGYYVGMDHIRQYYVNGHKKRRQDQLDKISRKHPEIADIPENLGLGCMEINPITTPQMELAEDGKTARCIWFSSGQNTELDENLEPKSNWVFERTGIDYIREEDGWKIWHLYSALELFSPSGMDYGKLPLEPALPVSPYEEEFSDPDIAFLTHDTRYNWWDGYPEEPRPYVTFDPAHSYAPEGHPAMQDKEAMFKWKRGLHKW